MASYDYECPDGHVQMQRFNSFRDAPKHLRCRDCGRRAERKFPISVQMMTFEPYVSEAINKEPTWIGSRRDRDRLLAAKGLRIKDKGE